MILRYVPRAYFPDFIAQALIYPGPVALLLFRLSITLLISLKVKLLKFSLYFFDAQWINLPFVDAHFAENSVKSVLHIDFLSFFF